MDLASFNGIVLVYSITDSSSLRFVLDLKWDVDKRLQKLQIRQRPRFILLANKTDLSHAEKVTELEGKQAAAILGCEFVALAARGHWKMIEKAFQIIVEKMRTSKRQQRRHHWTTIVDQVISNRSSVAPAESTHTNGLLSPPLLPTPRLEGSSRDSLLSDNGDDIVTSPTGQAKGSSLTSRVIKRVSSFKRYGAPLRRPDRRSTSCLDAVPDRRSASSLDVIPDRRPVSSLDVIPAGASHGASCRDGD